MLSPPTQVLRPQLTISLPQVQPQVESIEMAIGLGQEGVDDEDEEFSMYDMVFYELDQFILQDMVGVNATQKSQRT